MDSPVWEWMIERSLDPGRVRRLLADLLDRPVYNLDDPPARSRADGAILCQVSSVPGQFPTLVCCYGVPDAIVEWQVIARFAGAAQARCMLSDDTLNPYRRLLADPAGTVRPVHVNINDLDEAEAYTLTGWCTASNSHCREDSGCQRSRVPADTVLMLPPDGRPAT